MSLPPIFRLFTARGLSIVLSVTLIGCGRFGFDNSGPGARIDIGTCLPADSGDCEQTPRSAEFLIAGFRFNQADTVSAAVVVEGDLEVSRAAADRFAKTLAEFESPRSVGNLLGYGTDDRAYFVPFPELNGQAPEPNIERVSVELSWSNGFAAVNGPGDDVVIFESGSAGAPEPFGISVRAISQSTMSRWRYEFPDDFDTTEEVFATAIDFSDFGVPEGDIVDTLRVSNVFNSDANAFGTGPDRVDDPVGEGFIVRFGDPGYDSSFTLGTAPNAGEATTDRLDTDIVYVVALRPLVRVE